MEETDVEPGRPKDYRCTKVAAGENAVMMRRDNVEVASPFKEDGLIENWDLFESLLSHTLRRELGVDTRENALMYADPNHNGRKARERISEIVFEKFDVPAVYLARSAVLSAYANGRSTGIVLDVGHSGTSAVPVEDGTIVKGKFIRTAIGGRSVSERLMKELEKKEVKLRPLWSYKRSITGSDGIDEDNMVRKSKVEELSFPSTRPSFENFAKLCILEQVKAGLCVVHENPTVQLDSLPMVSRSYELPDGNTLEMGKERFAIAESTVFGTLPHISTESTSEKRVSLVNQYISGVRENGPGADQPQASVGLHGLVVDAIRLCDTAIHRDMYAGVCLTGGTSEMKGLFERLSYGLLETYHKVRVLAATGNLERKYCAWTGGSILATFAEFQKMWFSKSEYEENGSSFVHRKCP
eukprot:GFKZ01008615.1.p1 GENE.GFKZ01008615.1~~GFKZ01008615.1.p1  ORF type:complete len:412 (-),score=61.44 GFKZ01008615.1:1305-2540(-)